MMSFADDKRSPVDGSLLRSIAEGSIAEGSIAEGSDAEVGSAAARRLPQVC